MIEDEVQLAAATSEAGQVLVIAPPGCGKTEMLAMRAEALIPRLLSNQRILALTFSNRARDNLAERMRTHLGPQRYRRYVRVRNFHGHATEIVAAHCRTVGMGPEIVLPTKQLLERALRAVTANEDQIAAAKDALSAAKREPHDDEEVAAALAASGSGLAVMIEQARAQTTQLHYDDLLRHAQRLLRIEPVARLYQQHYGAILLDEFQDLSPQQLDIALLSCLASRTFVGDPLQGIYGWAGAKPVVVQEQLTNLCGAPYRLTKSYRSSPAVLAMLNSVGVPLGATALESGLPDDWPNGGASTAIVFTTGRPKPIGSRPAARTFTPITRTRRSASSHGRDTDGSPSTQRSLLGPTCPVGIGTWPSTMPTSSTVSNGRRTPYRARRVLPTCGPRPSPISMPTTLMPEATWKKPSSRSKRPGRTTRRFALLCVGICASTRTRPSRPAYTC
jgi:hypothetical protein